MKNVLIYCDNTGIIEMSEYLTSEEAIRQAKIIIREYLKAKTVNLVGLKINFSDGTTAVYNNIQKSDCLLVSAPPVVFGDYLTEDMVMPDMGDR